MELQETQSNQPSVGSGVAVLFYVLSFAIPLIGLVLWANYKGKPAAADRAMASNVGAAAGIGFVLNLLYYMS